MAYEHLPPSAGDHNPMPLPNGLLLTITCLGRDRLEKLITVAIDYLDILDGDPDLEAEEIDRCEAFDDGMYRVFVGGRWRWGSEQYLD